MRALLLDPVDLRGIPWRDGADRTRWAPPSFLPPSDDPGRWLINLEELPSAVPMVQAALYQLVLDRKCGEYELPEGASLIACGNRANDRGVTHRMPTPLASRFVHLEIRVDAVDWCSWARRESHRRTDIPLTNFRGIELRDFSAEIARLALIIAEYQCDVLYRGQKEALVEFLPLDAMNWITCGNALRLDWLGICLSAPVCTLSGNAPASKRGGPACAAHAAR